MAYLLKKIGNAANIPFQHFNCDDVADLSDIDVTLSPMGSTCYVINTGEYYTLNSMKQWKKNPTSSSSSSGGESGELNPDDNYIYDGGEEA